MDDDNTYNIMDDVDRFLHGGAVPDPSSEQEQAAPGSTAIASEAVVESLYESLDMLPDQVVRGVRRYFMEHWIDGRGTASGRIFPTLEEALVKELQAWVLATFGTVQPVLKPFSEYTADLGPDWRDDSTCKYNYILDILDLYCLDHGVDL